MCTLRSRALARPAYNMPHRTFFSARVRFESLSCKNLLNLISDSWSSRSLFFKMSSRRLNVVSRLQDGGRHRVSQRSGRVHADYRQTSRLAGLSLPYPLATLLQHSLTARTPPSGRREPPVPRTSAVASRAVASPVRRCRASAARASSGCAWAAWGPTTSSSTHHCLHRSPSRRVLSHKRNSRRRLSGSCARSAFYFSNSSSSYGTHN